MTPIHMLGFHFCKWYNISADMMMQRNRDFTNYGFPVDVLWMDIGCTYEFQYFQFNPSTFNVNDLATMKSVINISTRRLVVITDPHIKY